MLYENKPTFSIKKKKIGHVSGTNQAFHKVERLVQPNDTLVLGDT